MELFQITGKIHIAYESIIISSVAKFRVSVYYKDNGNENKTYEHGGLGVTCSPRDPRFAGSNPTKVT